MKLRAAKHGRDHRLGGWDPIPGIAEIVRIVRGSSDDDATVLAGTGFSITWDNNGGAPVGENYYTIYFDEPFTNPPVVAAIANTEGSAFDDRHQVTRVASNVAYVVLRVDDVDDADSTTPDSGFDFICVEPAA